MHIVCPHCTTSYAINPPPWVRRTHRPLLALQGNLAGAPGRCDRNGGRHAGRHANRHNGLAGRKRCLRPNGKRWRARKRGRIPVVDSPSISAAGRPRAKLQPATATGRRPPGRMRRTRRDPYHAPPAAGPPFPAALPAPHPLHGVRPADRLRRDGRADPGADDLARRRRALLPQTATFYKMVGLEVNLRGLAFKDIKISNETVDGKPVLVIEGTIVGETGNRSNCRGCAFRPRRAAPRSTPGTRCSNSRCSSLASAPTSSRGCLAAARRSQY